MIKKKFLWIIAIVCFVSSCNSIDDSTTDGKVKKAFLEWAKVNLPTRAKVKSVSYDTVGCPMDFMFSATMLRQTVGCSGHAESEINIASSLIGLDCILDSSTLTTNILIAKIEAQTSDSICTYYMGMRGDSVCTSPQIHGYKALIKTHKKGEQRLYDACYEIYCNLNDYVIEKAGRGRSTSKEGYYEFWVSLPSYEEALKQTTHNPVSKSSGSLDFFDNF